MTELKPCPFCGGKAYFSTLKVKEHYTEYDVFMPVVECEKCYVCISWDYDKASLAKKWNTRQPVINWQPITNIDNYDFNELQEFIFYTPNSFFYFTGETDINGLVNVHRYSLSYSKEELKEMYTYFAEITPPKEQAK